MKKGFSRYLCLVLVIISLVCVCGCSAKVGQKTIALENGWSFIFDISEYADKALAKGFSSEELYTLSQLTAETDSGCCYSNTFNGNLNIASGEKAILNIYDAKGDISIWLNGKEITAEQMGAGKYSFDVTKTVKGGKNTLVIKAAAKEEKQLVSPGSSIDITVHAPVYVEDAYTVSDMENNLLKVFAVVNNTTDKSMILPLKADIASIDNNAVSSNYMEEVEVPAGQSVLEFSFNSTDFIQWSNENPFLYMLTINLGEETYSDYVGYKTFTVEQDGKFAINGNPILIKAADITEDECYAKNLYEILNYIKVAGFNTVHVYEGVATERLLEYCDRLGLLVYEGATETSIELAKRDRSHVSLCLADMNSSAWEEAGVSVAVIEQDGIVNSLGEKVNMNIATANISNNSSINELSALKGENYFFKSVGVSGAKDNVVDISVAKDWYETFGIDAVMAMGEITDAVNNANVKENSEILDYVRNIDISGLCFTTDISRFKTDLTEIINDDLNDLRFSIITDKANAFNTDKIDVNINLSNFGVLTEGKYDILVKITGQGENTYKKTVKIEINPEENIQNIFKESISLAGYEAGEYVISAEFYEGAHAVCGEKTILVHDKNELPKTAQKVYTLDVSNNLTKLLEEQGATVSEFTGAEKGVIIIGENCTNNALIEKAYSNGTKVVILGAQNKDVLPVEGAITQNTEFVPVLHNSSLTENMLNTNVLYEVNQGGRILSENYFETSVLAEKAVSVFSVNSDGSVNAGYMFAMFEDKYVISTLAIEDNISNPYAAFMLLNAIK